MCVCTFACARVRSVNSNSGCVFSVCVCLTICLSVVGRSSATFFFVFAQSDVAKKGKKEVEKKCIV